MTEIQGDKEMNNRTIGSIIAVSYTHLDVYKRQRQYHGSGTVLLYGIAVPVSDS